MNKEKSQIAFCIATYRHADIINEVFGIYAELYKKYGIDIYVYDSSEDDDTARVVKEYQNLGCDNIFYIRIDPKDNVDEKLIKIFSGYGLNKEYQYIWPVKDRTIISEVAIQNILLEVEKNFDAIMLGWYKYPGIWECGGEKREIYNDADLFFDAWGWLASSLDVTLFSYNSLLKNIDWKNFKEKYFFDNHNGFDHYTVLFDRLANLKKVNVRVLSGEGIFIQNPKQTGSSWEEQVFHVWPVCFAQVTRAFPDCYNAYKEKVIKQACMLPWILGSNDRLIELSQKQILNQERFDAMRGRWEECTDLDEDEVGLIFNNKYQELADVLINKLNKLLEQKKYKDAQFLILRNKWLDLFWTDDTYEILQICFKIHALEKGENVLGGILEDICDYKDIIERYKRLIYLLRRIEFDLIPDTWEEIVPFISSNSISMVCLLFLISETNVDKEKVITRIATIFNLYNVNL